MVDDARFGQYILGGSAQNPPIPNAHVYRRMVHAGMTTAVEKALPQTHKILGHEALAELVDRFLAAGGPRTSLYRDIPGDFVEWVTGTDHTYADLMHYEWLVMTARRHPAELDELRVPADDFVRPNPTMQVGIYARPVHLMDEDLKDPPAYADPMAILVWRRPRTDISAHLPVGVLIARALSMAMQAPLRIGELAEAIAREVPALHAGDVRAKLQEVCAALRDEEGLLG